MEREEISGVGLSEEMKQVSNNLKMKETSVKSKSFFYLMTPLVENCFTFMF